MNNSKESATSGNSSEGSSIFPLAAATLLLVKYKAAIANEAPRANPNLPFQKMTRQQWMEVNL